MSRYIDWKDVVNKYAAGAKVGGASESNTPYIMAAEGEIDAWLAPYYAVPFTPVPDTVRDLTIDLAYYKMTLMQKGSKTLWDYIMARLKAIQGGLMQLTVSGTVLERVGAPYATRTAMVSSSPPHGGMSVEDPCFFDRPQS